MFTDRLSEETIEQGLLNLIKVYKSPGTFENADSDSVCLGQGLRFCISNKLRKTLSFPLTGPFSLFPVLPQSPIFTLLYNLFCFILLIELFLVCLFAFMSEMYIDIHLRNLFSTIECIPKITYTKES